MYSFWLFCTKRTSIAELSCLYDFEMLIDHRYPRTILQICWYIEFLFHWWTMCWGYKSWQGYASLALLFGTLFYSCHNLPQASTCYTTLRDRHRYPVLLHFLHMDLYEWWLCYHHQHKFESTCICFGRRRTPLKQRTKNWGLRNTEFSTISRRTLGLIDNQAYFSTEQKKHLLI